MSLLEVPYQIEVPQKGSANCHKIVAPPVSVLAPGASNRNFTEYIHICQ